MYTIPSFCITAKSGNSVLSHPGEELGMTTLVIQQPAPMQVQGHRMYHPMDSRQGAGSLMLPFVLVVFGDILAWPVFVVTSEVLLGHMGGVSSSCNWMQSVLT